MRLLPFVFLLFLVSCEAPLPDIDPSLPPAASTLKKETIDSNIIELFTSVNGGFSIHFPATPIKDVHTTSSEIGEIKLTQFIYSVSSENTLNLLV